MGTRVIQTNPCPMCGDTIQIEVPSDGFTAWKCLGVPIQVAMPSLTVDQRERLISGTCPVCWDKMFPEEDDE